MFIGVSMQLQAVFKYFLSHTVGLLPLKKKKKGGTSASRNADSASGVHEVYAQSQPFEGGCFLSIT